MGVHSGLNNSEGFLFPFFLVEFLVFTSQQEPNVMADEELSTQATKKGSLSPSSSRGSTTESSTLLQELKSTIS